MDRSKLVYRQITVWTFCCLSFMERRIYWFDKGFKWNRTKKKIYIPGAPCDKKYLKFLMKIPKRKPKRKNYLI